MHAGVVDAVVLVGLAARARRPSRTAADELPVRRHDARGCVGARVVRARICRAADRASCRTEAGEQEEQVVDVHHVVAVGVGGHVIAMGVDVAEVVPVRAPEPREQLEHLRG